MPKVSGINILLALVLSFDPFNNSILCITCAVVEMFYLNLYVVNNLLIRNIVL